MIFAAVIAVQLMLAACCLWLWLRLQNTIKRLDEHLATAAEASVLLKHLQSQLRDYLDFTVAAQANDKGLTSVPVDSRESHDPYRTIDELLAHMASLDDQGQISHQEKLIKAIYQLQDALCFPDTTLQTFLQPIIEQLRQSTVMGRPVGSVELVQRGTRVDNRTMWLLTRGTRVQQPLGVVVRDPEGQIINKAKVLCV